MDRLKALREGRDAQAEMAELPDDCRVRLIDLDTHIGGLIAVGEDGFVNIYLNARLSRDAQLRALEHELRHYQRGDLYSDRDIREVEGAAEGPDAPRLETIDGAPLTVNPNGFDPLALRPVGRGLYMPTGGNLKRAAVDIDCAAAGLQEGLRMFDILQTPPLLSVERLNALTNRLGCADIAFLAWHTRTPGAPPAAVLTLLRDSSDRMDGSLYYDGEGRLDNALIRLAISCEPAFHITVDLRRRRGGLAPCAITREVGSGSPERLF